MISSKEHMHKAEYYIFLACLMVFICMWLVSCISAKPAVTGTPTPSSTPTPLPDTYSITVTGEPLPTDILGLVIEDENHYFDYMSFGDIRIYEYETGTFLDAICINAYPLPLDGELQITFYGEDGRMTGYGKIHTADGGTVMSPGSTRIYAEINTDISLLDKDFVWEINRTFLPVTGES